MVTFVFAFQSIVYVTVISVMALYGRDRNATIHKVVIYSQNAT